MKVIILAAGRGTRLKPITDITPKPLIKIRGKSILENLLEEVIPYVDEIILVVNYKKEVFKETLWDNYCGVPIIYKEQWEKKGTGAAIEGIESSDDVLVVYADSLFSRKDIVTLATLDGYGCLVQEVENPEKYGIFSQDVDGNAIEVVEKPEAYIGNLANLWAYKFSPEILKLVKKLNPSTRGEYELTDSINEFCKHHAFKLLPIEWHFLDVSYPEDIEKTELYLQKKSQEIFSKRPLFWKHILLDTLKNFEIYYGISGKHVDELINFSQDLKDTSLQENTGDLKRFTCIEGSKKWYNDAEDRHVFTLVSHCWKLAGLWWARPCSVPDIWEVLSHKAHDVLMSNTGNLHTGGVRIYPDFRGKRIATPFVNKCSLYYSDIFPKHVMCVDVHEENIPMQKWFQRSGYSKVGYGQNNNTSKKNQTEKDTEKRFVYIQQS